MRRLSKEKFISLERLISTVAPPVAPEDSGSPDEWEELEKRLAMKLPHDYQEIIGTYGTGTWSNFLWMLNPFSGNKNLNLELKAAALLDSFRYMREQDPDIIPLPIYPESSGIFSLGCN